MSKFGRVGFLTFGPVFVSCDFEVGTNVCCEELTVRPHAGLIFYLLLGRVAAFS